MVKALRRSGMAAAAIAVAFGVWMADLPHWSSEATANGEVRTIAFYNVHNKETLEVTYKKNGRYIPSAMKKINYIMRDWRQNTPTRMDPKLIDLIWELRQELGTKKPTHLISGYRSAKTNNMLRRIGRKVARRSMHVKGQAADLYFPDVPLVKVRNSALVREIGGVGYYPRSGKHGFVHVDTGTVRHWPRLSKTKLAKIFRNRKVATKHNARDTSKGPIYLTQRNRSGAKSAGARKALRIANGAPLPRPKPNAIARKPEPVQPPVPAPAPVVPQTVVAEAKPAAPKVSPPTVTFAALSPAPAPAPTPAPAPAPAPAAVASLTPPQQQQPAAAARPRLVFFPLAILRRNQEQQAYAAPAEEQPVPAEKTVPFRGTMTDIATASLVPQNNAVARQATRQFTAAELARIGRQVVNRNYKGNLLMSLHARPVPNTSDKSAPLNVAQAKIDLRGPSFSTAVEDVEKSTANAAAAEPVDPAGEQPVSIPSGLSLR